MTQPTLGRRAFLAAVAGGLAVPAVAGAQPAARIPRVGALHTKLVSGGTSPLAANLQSLGYVPGTTITLVVREAGGRVDRLPVLAAELVGLNVDVIVAWGLEPLDAARKATSRIPIVMVAGGDPVATGLVTSLARPGGQITGVTVGVPEIAGKRLELVREALPGLSRVAVLRDPNAEVATLQRTEDAARTMKLQLVVLTVRGPADFDRAFREAVKAQAKAVLINETSMFTAHGGRLADLALRSRLPAIGQWKFSAQAGYAMTYGPEPSDLFRRAATYVDKILKGAKPGDLPIERPTKFELVINRKTVKALGLAIPPGLLQRADHVIE